VLPPFKWIVCADRHRFLPYQSTRPKLRNETQRLLIEAHSRQAKAPLLEVERLFATLTEGWREAPQRVNAEDAEPVTRDTPVAANTFEDAYSYAGYLVSDGEYDARPIVSF
jgi:hypothetical protein